VKFFLKLKSIAIKTRRFFTLEKYRLCYLHRWVLPRLKEFELCGVCLDISSVSLKMKEIIHSKLYENSEVMMCDKIIEANDRILELGGAIGFIGIYCQKKLGVSDYFSVEANPKTVSILKKNYFLNGLEPKVLTAALSDQTGSMDFFSSNDFFTSSVFLNTTFHKPEKITVDGMMFQDIIKSVPFECTAVVMDVEGAERFLNPANIPASVRKMVIELHPDILGVSEIFDYLVQLNAVGFRVVSFHYHTFALTR
jgi:FkbM family methyltransferase